MKVTIVNIILSVFIFFHSNVSAKSTGSKSCGKSLTCSSKKAPIALDPRSIHKLTKFFKTQLTGAKLFDKYLYTVEHSLIQAFTEDTDNDEDVYLPMEKLVTKYGYKIKKYTVKTDDGYKLGIFRIPSDGPPVIFIHGTCGSSEDFVTAGPDDGMGYALSRVGYDVYFLNVRGSKFSQQHEELSPKCAEFWDFSFNEIGRYDIPATIDFVIKKSGYDSVSLIGWSQGSTSSFIMGSVRPEYNKKVNLLVALSPVVYMNNCISPILRLLALEEDLTYIFLRAVGMNDFAPDNVLTESLTQIFCSPNPVAKIACNSFLSIFTGYDGCHANVTSLPVEVGHNPSGCATKHVIHYAQGVNSGKFRPFDYGKKKNMNEYGCEEPPEYELENVSCPVALFYGDRDWIANVTDVRRAKARLPNVVKNYCIEGYGHLDYVWSNDVTCTVTNKIIDLLQKYAGDDSC